MHVVVLRSCDICVITTLTSSSALFLLFLLRDHKIVNDDDIRTMVMSRVITSMEIGSQRSSHVTSCDKAIKFVVLHVNNDKEEQGL